MNFFNDNISDIDYLGYEPYINSFKYILDNCDKLLNPPIVFGIHAKWGSGKSTFMNLIEKRIKDEFYIIKINPWEYGKNQNFITIFLAKLYEAVKNKYRVFGDKSGNEFLAALFKPLKLSAGIGSNRMEYDFSKISFEPQQSVIDAYISENFALKEAIDQILRNKFIEDKKIVVFVDDLDRCEVNRIMEVIESIKLIFNSQNCIFFLGCDIKYIENALSEKYGEAIQNEFENFSREYLEKIIQIPFNIPVIGDDAIKGYIKAIINRKSTSGIPSNIVKEDLFKSFKKGFSIEFASELAILTNISPRRIKRIVNLSFLNYVFMKHKNINLNVDTKLLFLISFISDVFPTEYKNYLATTKQFKKTLKDNFELYTKVDFINEGENNESIINKEIECNANSSSEEQKDIIDEVFNIFFELSLPKKKSNEYIEEILNNIHLYISVSNLSTLKTYDNIDDEDNERLYKVRSEITGKSLRIFLKRIDNKSIPYEFINWFITDIYLKNKEKMNIGIVRNVQVYTVVNEERRWVFKFEYDAELQCLKIIFEWNNFKNEIDNYESIITTTRFDSKKKCIIIDNDLKEDELNIIKNDIISIISSEINLQGKYLINN